MSIASLVMRLAKARGCEVIPGERRKVWWTWPGSNRRPPACKAEQGIKSKSLFRLRLTPRFHQNDYPLVAPKALQESRTATLIDEATWRLWRVAVELVYTQG